MAGNDTMTFTSSNFQSEVLDSDVPVMIDFWAVWCGPCRAVAPLVDQLATEFQGRAKVGKIDVDSERELAQQFSIASIPTVLVFKGGEVVEQVLGARPKPVMASMLEKHI